MEEALHGNEAAVKTLISKAKTDPALRWDIWRNIGSFPSDNAPRLFKVVAEQELKDQGNLTRYIEHTAALSYHTKGKWQSLEALKAADPSTSFDLEQAFSIAKTDASLYPCIKRLLASVTSEDFAAFYQRTSDIQSLSIAFQAGIDVSECVSLGSLVSEDAATRFDAFTKLTYSHKMSRPVPIRTYTLLKAAAPALFCEPSPRVRNQLFGGMRYFLFRLIASTYALDRDHKAHELVIAAKEWLQWFAEWCRGLLTPGAPYRCQATCLQYIDLLLTIGLDPEVKGEPSPTKFPFSIPILTESFTIQLLNAVPSEFYDVRREAARLVSLKPRFVDVDNLIKHSLALMGGKRGREGDGAARVALLAWHTSGKDSNFLNQLISSTCDLATNLQFEEGLHGYFEALALLQKSGARLPADKLLKAIYSVWTGCEDVLCNGAPEGNAPRAQQAWQDTLSFSWRAVKESASLAAELVPFLDYDVCKELGTKIVQQITHIRHRGAFASLTPTLEAVCIKLGPELSLQWLNTELKRVREERMLVTRRSAGLPLLVTSILSTAPQYLNEVFDELFKMASAPVTDPGALELPQVHAFNCIRAIILDGRLDHPAEHVSRALELAFGTFENPAWVLRNCAVMLFATTHQRLFGVRPKQQYPAPVFFSRYPRVLQLLLDHFKRANGDTVESVYPGLAILLRLEPGNEKNAGLREIEQLTLPLLSSRIWKVRELTARVIGRISSSPDTVDRLVDGLSLRNQNRLHGHALALKELNWKPDRDLTHLIINNACFETRISLIQLQPGRKEPRPLQNGLNPCRAVFESFQAHDSLDETIFDDPDVDRWSPVYESESSKIPDEKWTGILERAKGPGLQVKGLAHVDSEAASKFTTNNYARSVQEFAIQRAPNIEKVQELASSEQPVSSRISAVKALRKVDTDTEKWILFNLLSDDDENVRAQAAVVASRVLEFPAVASPRYCEIKLVTRISPSYIGKQLAKALVQRKPDVDDTTDLFEVEKENMYRDLSYWTLLGSHATIESEPENFGSIKQSLSKLDFEAPFGPSAQESMIVLKAQIAAIDQSMKNYKNC